VTCPTHPIVLLEALREQSVDSIPARGLFSREFQEWHASALEVLQQNFDADDSVLQDFKRLQFEWPQEVLESLYTSQLELLKNSEAGAALQASKDAWILLTQQNKFLSAMQQARELLRVAIVSLRRSPRQ
jgi:hypothetical protein